MTSSVLVLPLKNVARPEGHPVLALVRLYQQTESRVARRILRAVHRLVQLAHACDIPLECAKIGAGLLLPHRGIGVVIHPSTVIGINCCIFHHCTLGTNGDDEAPTLGDCVELGPGASVLGGVKIGDYAQIGAGAIVTRDVPAYALVTGANRVRPNAKRFPAKVVAS